MRDILMLAVALVTGLCGWTWYQVEVEKRDPHEVMGALAAASPFHQAADWEEVDCAEDEHAHEAGGDHQAHASTPPPDRTRARPRPDLWAAMSQEERRAWREARWAERLAAMQADSHGHNAYDPLAWLEDPKLSGLGTVAGLISFMFAMSAPRRHYV